MKKVTGIILAGGKSSRMGREKGLIELNGKMFIQHVVDALRPLVDEIIIVANNSEYDKLGYKVLADQIKDCGPMGGIYTGLSASKTQKNIVLSCDIPDVSPKLLRQLLFQSENFEVTIPVHNGWSEPLCAVYDRSCAGKLKELLEKKEFKMRDALKNMNANYINMVPGECFSEADLVNINTPEELEIRKQKIK